MKSVIQRVTRARVTVDGEVVGEITRGLVILLGVGGGDDASTAEKLANKICKLRIFADEESKTNRSITDVGGEILVVSQFTLYADCAKNRPSFSNAAPPQLAQELYEHFTDCLRQSDVKGVACGVFGASMQVELTNDGPFTIVLEM
ncbi:MAG: D-aminoacyl-tRNA deacylase [Oscillospiraceae bacterium]|nr:D-aminoacyl-tRNA deacylase [Oscillospiraceae bacterium]